jgi:tRNA-uridine 2-sulfurtransferase
VGSVRELLGDAGSAADWAWIRLRVGGRQVLSADGSGPGIDELVTELPGKTLLEAAAVPGSAPATDALAAAIGPAVTASPEVRRLAVAMSGGVDSAVSLLRALADGFEPVGVTLRLWLDPSGPDSERACCSPSSVRAARELCHALGVPHVTLDERETFRRAVVDRFVDGYAQGQTPNPCIACNGSFRFRSLLAFTQRVGAALLATGHYARTCRHRGRLLLARGADGAKDQSYMLARLDPRVLDRIWFPLGEQDKATTRAQAEAAGLAVATLPESQEACFLAGGDYRDFLARRGLSRTDGPIVDLEGRELGRHEGFWRFTPGQRRGLALAASGTPLYAVRTEPARNTVVVGTHDALRCDRLTVRPGKLHVPVDRVSAKLRYRSPAVPARVSRRARGFALALESPVHGAAAGQAAVLYEGDAVVGAGLICSTG